MMSLLCIHHWCSEGHNLKARAKAKASTLKTTTKAWTYESKAIGHKAEAEVFKHTAIEEIKIRSTSDSLTG